MPYHKSGTARPQAYDGPSRHHVIGGGRRDITVRQAGQQADGAQHRCVTAYNGARLSRLCSRGALRMRLRCGEVGSCQPYESFFARVLRHRKRISRAACTGMFKTICCCCRNARPVACRERPQKCVLGVGTGYMVVNRGSACGACKMACVAWGRVEALLIIGE